MLYSTNYITIRRISIFIILATVLAFFVFVPVLYADTPTEGLNKAANKAYTGTPDPGEPKDNVIKDIPTAIGKIVGAVLAFIGILFFVLMIYGGFTWMTARGNEQAVAKAKDLITAAVIGLIIVLAAYAITKYIGETLFL